MGHMIVDLLLEARKGDRRNSESLLGRDEMGMLFIEAEKHIVV